MLNVSKIQCCNHNQNERFNNIGSNVYFTFIDECGVCGQPVAEIKERNKNGELITRTRRSGAAAIRLFEKYGLENRAYTYTSFSGTKEKEYSFCNIRGEIYNFNGVKIASQDKFLKMSREEINAKLNERFYRPIRTK